MEADIFGRIPGFSADRRLSRREALTATGAGLAAAVLGGGGGRVVGAQEATPVTTADSAFPIEDELAFDAILDTSMAGTVTPGALAGVWYPGRGAWRRAAGTGDIATATPMALDNHVRIASVTKTFVATVILQLVDEGEIAFDDRLEGFITGVPNGAEITLRQMLGMTAGIYNYLSDPVFADEEEYDAEPLLSLTPEDALAIIRASTPDFPPGERVQYSNSNYILLGMIAEQVTGQPIESLIQERILAPLGLAQTSLPATSDMPVPYAHGYAAGTAGEALPDVTFSNPGFSWTSGGMISTLDDLGIWAAALAQGTLLSPEIQQERLVFGPMSEARISVGYGLGIMSVNGLIGHNGGIQGYSSWVMHDPDSGASIVVVTNRGSDDGGTSDSIFLGLARHLFPERFSVLNGAASTLA